MTTYINADDGIISGVPGLKYGSDSSGSLVLQTNGTTAITISASQVVTFSNAVNFSTASFTNLEYTGTLTGGTGVVNLGTGQFYKDASGNIGIGTDVPLGALDVARPTTSSIVIRSAGSGVSSYLIFKRARGTLTSPTAADGGAVLSNITSDGFDGTNYVSSSVIATTQTGTLSTGIVQSYTSFSNANTSGVLTERFRVDSNGNFGIGTNSPSYLLDVATTTVRFSGSTASGANLLLNNTQGTSYKSQITWATNNVGKFSIGVDASAVGNNNFYFYDDAVGTLRMIIDSGGNVGIGTTTPQSSFFGKLAVSGGNIAIAGGSSLLLWDSANSGLGQIGSPAANTLAFTTGGSSERMRIIDSGYVGIGTSSPTVQLQVNIPTTTSDQRTGLLIRNYTSADQDAAMTADIDFSLWDNNTRITTPQARIGIVGDSTGDQNYEAGGQLCFYTNIRNYLTPVLTERMRIDSSGNVGIGTATPGAKLNVVSTAGGALAFFDQGTTGVKIGTYLTNTIWGLSDTTVGTGLFGSGNSYLYLATAGSERMRITSTGNVGIGISTPTTTLHSYGASQSGAIIQTGAQSFIMFGKTITSYFNATAANLCTFSVGGNTGVMVKVVIRGTSAVSNQMWEDVGYAWWRWLAGSGYVGSGVTTVTNVINVQGTHTVGTLSWANPSTAPALQYTQGGNGYILESIDVYVTCRDALAGFAFAPASLSFG